MDCSKMQRTIILQVLLLVVAVSAVSNNATTNSTAKPRAHGYHTYVQRPNFAVANSGGQRYNTMQQMNNLNFNPFLLRGSRNFPGIRVRMNRRAFAYASQVVAGLISQEIGRARIPDINQCVPQANGCVRIANMYIAHYRCPQSVAIYPWPNNHIRISIRNFELRIMGNIQGQFNILIPLGLCGVLCMDADQISLEVELAIQRNNMGQPFVSVTQCQASVGYVNVYIYNGGFIGWVINSAFRQMVESQVREMIPKQLCSMLPNLVNNMVNPKLAQVPQIIQMSQIISVVNSVLGTVLNVPAYCNSPMCRGVTQSSSPAGTQVTAPQVAARQNQAGQQQRYAAGGHYNQQRYNNNYNNRQRVYNNRVYNNRQVYNNYNNARRYNNYNYQQRYAQQRRMGGAKTLEVSSAINETVTALAITRSKRHVNQQCAGCPAPGSGPGAIREFIGKFDLRKISDLALSLRIMNMYATQNDFTIDLSGEFSPRGYGGTPFGPFPPYFPYAVGNSMIEAVVSDYTINSLLFWLHRREFFMFRIGPEAKAFASLLSTTCGEDYDYDSDETDTDTATDPTTRRGMRRKILKLLKRTKRQSLSTLEDLGVCIGDIAPAIAEKYPNKKLYLIIRTARAPSILISANHGGMVTAELIADVAMYLDGTNTRVGNLRVTVVLDATIRMRGNWISGTAALRTLHVKDTEGTLGMPQDALDSVASLAKGAVVKMINDALGKGMRMPMPNLPIPVSLYNTHVGIIEHGIYLGSDFTVSNSMFAGMMPSPGAVACHS